MSGCGCCISYFPGFLVHLSLLTSHCSVYLVLQSLGRDSFYSHATQYSIVSLHGLMPHNGVKLNALMS